MFHLQSLSTCRDADDWSWELNRWKQVDGWFIISTTSSLPERCHHWENLPLPLEYVRLQSFTLMGCNTNLIWISCLTLFKNENISVTCRYRSVPGCRPWTRSRFGSGAFRQPQRHHGSFLPVDSHTQLHAAWRRHQRNTAHLRWGGVCLFACLSAVLLRKCGGFRWHFVDRSDLGYNYRNEQGKIAKRLSWFGFILGHSARGPRNQHIMHAVRVSSSIPRVNGWHCDNTDVILVCACVWITVYVY